MNVSLGWLCCVLCSLQSIQCEIERLDSSIAGAPAVDTLPIQLCRRGALLRKVEHLLCPPVAARGNGVAGCTYLVTNIQHVLRLACVWLSRELK